MSKVIITGVTGSANRLEIHDFVKNDKFFSLYVQALQLMSSATSQNDVRSFFQVGGIHGLPYVPWDGVTGNQPFNPQAQWGGYCTHGSVLFPTWHRPYVLLYEQLLHTHAQQIAATYTTPDKDAWLQAAANLRQPYWDWAANAIPPDQVIALKQVAITGPNGQKITVDNPLYHYKFHPIDPSFPDPFSQWPTTLRQPNSERPNATDNVTRLKNVLRAAQTDITTSTYSMLTRVHTWAAFSNHTVGDGGSTSNSLEAIHDGIHVDVGGNGHMSDPAVAALDPIFFLHHANVDRLLSLWSALNPTVWVSPGDSEDGTFILPPQAPVDQTTPLTPFSNTETTFWASSAVTDTAKLGYTYPEFNGLDLGNTSAVQRAIGNSVNRLYGSSIFGFFNAAAAAPVPAPTPAPASAPIRAVTTSTVGTTTESLAAHVPPAKALPAATAPPAPVPVQVPAHVTAGSAEPSVHVSHEGAPVGHLGHADRVFYDWTARITFKKYEFGSSFSVLLFIGSVPENPEEWHVSPTFVGAHHAFVNSVAGHCANCRNQGDLVIEGFVHLTQYIVKHAGLASLEPEVVEPYLTQQLHWRVQKADGSVAQLESLQVSVYGSPVSYPPGAMFPVAGERHHFHGITHGRAGLLPGVISPA